jgi:hypothetical protein
MSVILTDVWKNHVLAFLLPNKLRMRKHLSVVLFEMMCRMEIYSLPRLKCSLLGLQDEYRTFWVSDTVAVVSDKVPPSFGTHHYILHLSHDGRVHCITRVIILDGVYPRWITCDNSLLHIDRTNDKVMYYTRKESHLRSGSWEHGDRREINAVCLMRAWVLHSIRRRNR